MARLWWHRTRRLFLGGLVAVGLVMALAAAGAVYQSVSVRREAGRFPPPGQLVDIGGRRLHLLCIGDGAPVVIFESSGSGNSLSASKAREAIATRTRVCSYDRAGTGWSDPGASILSAGALVDDLERLLERAHIPAPYVLVPASIGGITAELFARRHPASVAGMVFLDAATSDGVDRLLPEVTWARTELACLAPLAVRLGLPRLIDLFNLRAQAPEQSARAAALMYRPEPVATLCRIVRGAADSSKEFHAAPPLSGNLPLVVLSAETEVGLLPPNWPGSFRLLSREDRYGLHQSFARRSSRGEWRVVPGSSHLIASSQPQAVADAVIRMVEHIRGGSS